VKGHAAPFCQVPAAVHVCGVTPSLAHCVEAGVHTPVQLPALQTNEQALPLCQEPLASHDCGVRPEHCVAPGTHDPAHAPAVHT
jgi:hypothetical protein